MNAYRFRYWAGAKPVYEDEVECASDRIALDHAQVFAADFDVEIWNGPRFLTRIKKGSVPAPADPPPG